MSQSSTATPPSRLSRFWHKWRFHINALLLLIRQASATGHGGRGDFHMDTDGRLSRRGDAPMAPCMFAGVQVIKPTLFAEGPAGAFSTNLIWDRLIARCRREQRIGLSPATTG